MVEIVRKWHVKQREPVEPFNLTLYKSKFVIKAKNITNSIKNSKLNMKN